MGSNVRHGDPLDTRRKRSENAKRQNARRKGNPPPRVEEPRGRTSPEGLTKAELRNEILRLRRDGLTDDKISTELEKRGTVLTQQAVSYHLRKYLEELANEDAQAVEHLRELENRRLDELWELHYEKAKNGNMHSGRFCLKIMERRAKMNGLDAPKKHEHVGAVAHLHALGVDFDEIQRAEEAYQAAFSEPGVIDPEVIEVEPEEIEPAELLPSGE
jgi:DNA-binding transcriptional ArsR family regulator